MEPYYFGYFSYYDIIDFPYFSTKRTNPYKRPIKRKKPVVKKAQASKRIYRKQGR